MRNADKTLVTLVVDTLPRGRNWNEARTAWVRTAIEIQRLRVAHRSDVSASVYDALTSLGEMSVDSLEV
jgi:hypothetical protein